MRPRSLFDNPEAWVARDIKGKPAPATPIVTLPQKAEKPPKKTRAFSPPTLVNTGQSPAVRAVVAHVANVSGVSVDELCGLSRRRWITRYRQIAMYLARRFTDRSLPVIGTELGWRDHTTILHGIRLIQKHILAEGISPIEDTLEAWADALLSHYRDEARARAKKVSQARTRRSHKQYWAAKAEGKKLRGPRTSR